MPETLRALAILGACVAGAFLLDRWKAPSWAIFMTALAAGVPISDLLGRVLR